MLILILILLIVFGGGWGYHTYGYSRYGNGGFGIIGLIVLILILYWFFGGGLGRVRGAGVEHIGTITMTRGEAKADLQRLSEISRTPDEDFLFHAIAAALVTTSIREELAAAVKAYQFVNPLVPAREIELYELPFLLANYHPPKDSDLVTIYL